MAGERPLIVRDAWQAHGACWKGRPAGSFGTAAAFSFYPGKNLGALGDGGAIVTSDADLAARCREWRSWGSKKKYHHDVIGGNSRLDAIQVHRPHPSPLDLCIPHPISTSYQAAVLRIKLRALPTMNRARSRLAARYLQLLKPLHDSGSLTLPRVLCGCESAWHLFVISTPRRDEVLTYLNGCGIGAAIHYPIPLHELKAFSKYASQAAGLQTASQLSREILSLPLFPEMSDEQQDRVVDTLHVALNGTPAAKPAETSHPQPQCARL